MNSGYIKLWRKIQKTSFYKKPLINHLAVHLILEANHTSHKFIWNKEELIIERGQILTGRKTLSNETGLSQRNVRTALKTLKNIAFLTIKVTSKFSIITICNYSKYQDCNYLTDQQSDQQVTSKRPASDQQVTTYNNDKNVKNDKKHIYGEFKNVKLTDEEYQKLKDKFNNDAEKWIKTVDEGIEYKGYKYKSHYMAILKWAEKKGQGKKYL